MRVGSRRRRLDLGAAGVWPRVRYVLRDGPGEHRRVLGHDADGPTEPREVVGGYRHSVEAHGSLARVVEALLRVLSGEQTRRQSNCTYENKSKKKRTNKAPTVLLPPPDGPTSAKVSPGTR